MANQTALPAAGDTVATIHTTLGTIKVKLFPEETPKTCENFITHAKNGYYDGIIFHRVIKDFMIQGGDPDGTGRGGHSIWGSPFEDEFHPDILLFRYGQRLNNAPRRLLPAKDIQIGVRTGLIHRQLAVNGFLQH